MLRCKLLRPEATAPSIAHPGEDLGYDLYAAEAVVFPPRGHAIVPTGVAIELTSADGRPMGALVRDRSSMAARRLITTAVEVVPDLADSKRGEGGFGSSGKR